MISDPGDVSRARALDLLDQQRRRIVDLAEQVSAGQRTLERSTASLAWRSPARYEFNSRVEDLSQALARSSGSLRTALVECDRARDLLRAGSSVERHGGGWSNDFVPSGGTRR